MARRPRLFAPGILYHVIVRGNYRQKTFLNGRDYEAYLERLARYRKRFGVTVYAYCLMSNHVHLLLETGSEPLSKFMQGLQQSYTQYFNRKHHKVGHLFQGRYKAIVCEKDEYLLTLVRYIHLNPIRAKLVQRLDDYPYSGHPEYCGVRASEALETSRVLNMLGGRRSIPAIYPRRPAGWASGGVLRRKGPAVFGRRAVYRKAQSPSGRGTRNTAIQENSDDCFSARCASA